MIGVIWFIVGLTVLAVATPFILRAVFPHRMSWKEVGISVVASIVLSVLCVLTIMYGGKFNTEIHNGKVTNKDQVQVSCEHSYQVCSGSGENRTCTTYHEHSHDYDWRVYTSVGDMNINRVDRRGVREPPRFTEVIIGEHVAIENSYIDYLKGQESSLLYKKNHSVNSKFQKLVPQYPGVYDYYRSNPVIFSGMNISKDVREQYNDQLRNVLKNLGAQKQVNVVVVLVNTDDPAFGEYLRNEWRNGRKNDQVVVIGTSDYPSVEWAYAFGWSKNQHVNSSIKYDFNELSEITPEKLVSVIEKNVKKHFVRRPMEEFKSYLWETKVAWWQILLVIFIQIGVNVGLAIMFYRHDF